MGRGGGAARRRVPLLEAGQEQECLVGDGDGQASPVESIGLGGVETDVRHGRNSLT